jgi:hypothetical protein
MSRLGLVIGKAGCPWRTEVPGRFVAPHDDRLEGVTQVWNQFVAGVCDTGGHMPGDPAKCRLIGMRYFELSERAQDPERRENLAALAKTWSRLAAELECDQALLNALSQLSFDESPYAVPEALNLTAA